MTHSARFAQAMAAFDAYHQRDPNTETIGGKDYPKEMLYADRMSERLSRYAPDASESVKLAARCQHIGRWEIAREKYPMDRKGYLRWRNEEKIHHAHIAENILRDCGYSADEIEPVKSLLLKKGLNSNADAQLLEDVICQVFVEYYLDDFSEKHNDDKVVDILQKTLRKMSHRAKEATKDLRASDKTRALITRAMANA